MARDVGIKVENDFTKGLLTENNALSFPENACTETFNCVFKTGRVTRRGALDIEENYIVVPSVSESPTSQDVWTEYEWSNVAGSGTVAFLVQQEGNRLNFFDVSASTVVSRAKHVTTVNLDTFKAAGTPYDTNSQICQYTQGNGDLIVTNRACDPFYVSYNPDTSTLTATKITVQYRDFLGLTSFALNTRPGFADINALKVHPTGALHFYNILNQGWWQGGISSGNPDANSALGQWDTARGDLPSNADYVGYFRASPSDAFDPARVNQYNQGNTPAPKGHFILDLGDADRQRALTDAGYSLTFSSTYGLFIPRTTGSVIGDMTFNQANAFDGNKAQVVSGTSTATYKSSTVSNVAAAGYVGKNLGSAKRIYKAVVSPFTGTFFSGTAYGYYGVGSTPYPNVVTIELRAKTSLPTGRTDGVLLGTSFASPGTSSVTINSSDTTTPYQYVWINMLGSTTGAATFWLVGLSELDLYEAVTSTSTGSLAAADVTYERPQTCAFFASRAWYSGVDAQTLSNNIYFSQIIQEPSQYGKCYQQNDPTSEDFSDILPSDGGVIRVPEMGLVRKLYPYQTSLLVYATNGVWIIQANNGFTATDFTVRKISSLGTNSPLSFVDIKGIPTWFGEEAILQINYNPQFDSFSVDSLTDETIRTFFYTIPAENRSWVKGAFDVKDNTIYWLYANGANTYNSKTYYDSVLCLNVLTNAFFPWTFQTPIDVNLTGLVYIADSIGISPPKTKFVFRYVTGTDVISFGYADIKEASFKDWQVFATEVLNDPSKALSYTSYFITGYKVHGEAMKFVQPNYIIVYLDQIANSGCFVQGVFDFTDSHVSGKWGSKQQIYNSSLENRKVNSKRLKIRGKGRSIQFKFTSDGDKGFSIIGWGGLETANQEV